MTLRILIKRNIKLFFKDKGMFFTSLITPLILLVLYATFLANVYRDSFAAGFPAGFSIPDELLDATVGAQLMSSLLAVSCVTVAFCSNMLSVQDKVSGARTDLTVSPVRRSTMAISYYAASFISTLCICLVATAACLIYIATIGWYFTLTDILLIVSDVFLLVLFGTALSSLINVFLSTQGQISAVGSIISSVYGFVCGAYMPLSQFSEGLRNVLMFLPGTYGTSLIRNHCMNPMFREMNSIGLPSDVITALRDTVDCNIYLFGKEISTAVMYAVMLGSIVLILAAYIIIHNVYGKKRAK
ncbi:MAG: ABC transporter permease [Clostridia bacterium]|nr:ABC transporter permease [Clostridia bacterium]